MLHTNECLENPPFPDSLESGGYRTHEGTRTRSETQCRKQRPDTLSSSEFSDGESTLRTILVRIGYARISTDDQNLHLQHDALAKADCKKVFEDRISGAKALRPGLTAALEFAREGDVLVVWRLDRLGRSLKDLIDLAARLEASGVGLQSLQEAIDTTTSGGKLVFHIFGALAEFERNLIRERTQAGLIAARARGRRGGRPKALDERKRALAVQLYHERNLDGTTKRTVRDICSLLGISKSTFYSYLSDAAP